MSEPRRFKCRQKGCGKTYTDVIAESTWGGKGHATCIPCEFAGQMQHLGRTPADIEAVPELHAQMLATLHKMGWEWADLVDSFERVQVKL